MFSFILRLAILSFYNYLVTFYDGIHMFALLLPKFRGYHVKNLDRKLIFHSKIRSSTSFRISSVYQQYFMKNTCFALFFLHKYREYESQQVFTLLRIIKIKNID